MGRGRPRKRKDPADVPGPISVAPQPQERARGTMERSSKKNYKVFNGNYYLLLLIQLFKANNIFIKKKILSLQRKRIPISVPFVRIEMTRVVLRIA